MFEYGAALCQVTVNGTDISTLVNKKLMSLTLTDANGLEADTLDLMLDDSKGDIDIPPRGASIKIMLGWPDTGVVDKGTYTVDEIEHSGSPDTLTIRARSADLREGLTQKKELSWQAITVGDLVRKKASDNSYEAVVASEYDDMEPRHIAQQMQSDADLLTRLAEQYDAICTVKDGKLLFIKAGTGKTNSGIDLPTAAITRKSGDRHRFTIRDRDNYVAVAAYYLNTNGATKGKVLYDGRSAQQQLKEEEDGIVTLKSAYKSEDAATKHIKKSWKQLAGAGNKPKLLRARFDDKKKSTKGYITYDGKHIGKQKLDNPSATDPIESSANNERVLRHVYANETNAKNAAKAEYMRLQRARASFNLTLAKGKPELFPGQPMSVSGYKPAIDSSNWLLVRVVHRLDANNGYVTDIEAELLNNDEATTS
ncbi:MAG: contractile injection system protein, VgrG/Pvc8 family [Fluviibacter sp.]